MHQHAMVPLCDGPSMYQHAMVHLSDRPGTLDLYIMTGLGDVPTYI